MKRLLAMGLAAMLLLAFAGGALADDGLFGFQSSWDNYGLPTDPITLTICVGAQDIPSSGAIDSIPNRLITQATGITLDWVQTDTEKFAVLAAGGNLPDLISHEDMAFLRDLIAAGTLLDMAPMLDLYGQNILEVSAGYPLTFAKEMYGDGTALYYIPTYLTTVGDYQVASYNGGFGYYLRFDIYQAVGMPPVYDENGFSEDLFIDALKQMQDHVREATGSDTVYALSGFNSWGADWIVRHPYNFGISGRCGDSEVDQITGELLPSIGSDDSAWWDMVRFYNKAFLAGIFDPEAFTMTRDQYTDKLDNSELLVSCLPHATSAQMKEDYGETAGFFVVKGMPYFSGLITQDDPVGYGAYATDSINVNCQYPERAMALIDYLRSDEFMRVRSNGIEGEDWAYNSEGVPTYIGEALAAYQANTLDVYRQLGSEHFMNFPGDKWGIRMKICDDGFPNDFTRSAEAIAEKTATDLPAQNFLAAYGANDCRYPGELYLQWVSEGLGGTNQGFNPKTQFVPPATDEIRQLETKIRTYIKDNWARMIFAESAVSCEAIIEEVRVQVEDMGLDTYYQDVVARFAESERIAASLGY